MSSDTAHRWPGRAQLHPVRVDRHTEVVHPGEAARFWVATSAAILLIGLPLVGLAVGGGVQLLGAAALVVVTLWLVTWLGLQVWAARLLGGCLRVNPRSLPELAEVIDEQRARLGYAKRVNFYVAGEVTGSIRYTSYFGTKIVIVKGDLVAELDDPDRRAEAVFLVGSVLGHLAAQHLRFTPVSQAVAVLAKIKVFNFALGPYLRCAWYTGDNIGLMLCGDPRAALRALHRQFVGKELAPAVGPTGILEQARDVRRRLLPRAVALWSEEPHLTDRYLNALRFLAFAYPDLGFAWFRELDSATAVIAQQELADSPYLRRAERPGSTAWPGLAVVSVAIVAVVGVLWGRAGAGQPVAVDATTPVSPTVVSSPAFVTSPTQPAPVPDPAPTTTPGPAPAADALTVRAKLNDGQCAQHAFGRVQTLLVQAQCQGLNRALLTATVEGRPVLISVAVVALADPADDPDFIALISANGSGDIRTLIDDGHGYNGAPSAFADDPTFLAREAAAGTSVYVLEAMWLDGPTTEGNAALAAELAAVATQLD
jgi:hypothetical protein